MKQELNLKKLNSYKDLVRVDAKDSHYHANHLWLMLIAHIIPFVLIFILPILGFIGIWTFILPIVIIIAIHIWMIKYHLTKH